MREQRSAVDGKVASAMGRIAKARAERGTLPTSSTPADHERLLGCWRAERRELEGLEEYVAKLKIELLERQAHDKLRDQFAAAALTGALADFEVDGRANEIAAMAYRFADAMLAERAKAKP